MANRIERSLPCDDYFRSATPPHQFRTEDDAIEVPEEPTDE